MSARVFRHGVIVLILASASPGLSLVTSPGRGIPAPAAPLTAQTPEQRYTDWTRLEFRAQEYAYRRARILDGLRASGGGLLLTPSSDGFTHGETFRQREDFWYLTGLEDRAFDAGSGRRARPLHPLHAPAGSALR